DSGTCTDLSARATSRSVRRTTAPAAPFSPFSPGRPVAYAEPAEASAADPAASTVAVATAAQRRADIRNLVLFKVVEPPMRRVGTRQECPGRTPPVSDPPTLHPIGVIPPRCSIR